MRAAAAGIVAALAISPAAAAATTPDVQQRIVPGVSIGAVRLGMSLAEVERAVGKRDGVIKRERRGFGRQWVEYSWNLSEWRVAFTVVRGKHTVVAVRTSKRGERTREGVGIGTLGSTAERVLGTRCHLGLHQGRGDVSGPDEYALAAGYWCVLETSGRKTAFVVTLVCSRRIVNGRCPEGGERFQVTEVAVFGAAERLPVDIVRERPLP